MRIGSLFAGIGGLELGLERSIPGAHTVWQVEQNPYAQRVLAKHWPQAQRYDDVRQVGAHNLEPVDLLCGGFPCQDISVAGKQAGIDGERSGLWSEFARLIGELQPRFVVVENVSALLSGGMDRVLGDLAACGYDAVWDCVPAKAIGAHHQRDRVFIVGWLADTKSERIPFRQARAECSRRARLDRSSPGSRAEAVADTNSAGLEGHRPPGDARQVCPQKTAGLFRSSIRRAAAWEPEPDVGRVANGVPHRVDRLRGLGNAVVPQAAEAVGRVVCGLMEQDG